MYIRLNDAKYVPAWLGKSTTNEFIQIQTYWFSMIDWKIFLVQ